MPSAPLVVAAGQAACAALDIPANVAAAADLVRRAAEQGADLLVLPELFLICWDSSFPGHARAAALDACHAYLIGALFGGTHGERKRATVCPARALDNAMYVVMANHCGPSGPLDGCGGSAIWDPEGVLLMDAGSAVPGLATACLDPQVLARIRSQDCV